MPETVVRPNGKPYRPRRAPRLEVYTTTDDTTAIVVIGTHDLDAAAALAAHPWTCDNDGPLPTGLRRWWRLVPWGGEGNGSWIDDPIRGSAVVTFEPEAWR